MGASLLEYVSKPFLVQYLFGEMAKHFSRTRSLMTVIFKCPNCGGSQCYGDTFTQFSVIYCGACDYTGSYDFAAKEREVADALATIAKRYRLEPIQVETIWDMMRTLPIK